MSAIAIVFMIISMLTIWGGLAVRQLIPAGIS
jgi:hypothetical protein